MRSAISKVLHEVLGQPILGRILHTIENLSLDRIHIIVGHQSEQIKEYVGQVQLQTPTAIHLQEEQLGTGHAVLQAEEALAKFEGTILVLAGDTPLLSKETLAALMNKHRDDKADVSLLTVRVPIPKGYGRIVRSKKGVIEAIVEEKDATDQQKALNEINPGVYCFQWPLIKKGLHALKNDNKQGEYYLTDVIGWAVEKGLKLSSFELEDWREVVGVNSRTDLAIANSLMNERHLCKLSLESGVTIIDPTTTWIAPEVTIEQDTVILPGCWLMGNITIGSACKIGPNTVMEGEVHIGSRSHIVQSHLEDCQIGNACRIGPYAHLRPGSVISDEVKIGNFVEVKKSFIGLKTSVGHLSYIGDATIGNHVNIGAGTITANYDHYTKQKARTIIEDGASTGSNAVLVAPVTLGREAAVAAGTVITKDVPAESLAVRRASQETVDGWAARKKRKTPT
jgi:bifunctional UDP-N-acetylglucosamine pyrophosphorylase/glucosamine-1-phosphate N-acetyltransferase